jgi:hypothetical protein
MHLKGHLKAKVGIRKVVSEQDSIRLGKRKGKMDAVLTLVVANKPKKKYK